MYTRILSVVGLVFMILITSAQAADRKPAPRLSAEGKALLEQIQHMERETGRGLAGTAVRMRHGTSVHPEVRIEDTRELKARLHELERKIPGLDRFSQMRVRKAARELGQKIRQLEKARENARARENQKARNLRISGRMMAKKTQTPSRLPESTGAAPSNDLCGNATPVGEGTFAGDTSSATNDGSESCVGDPSEDIWYLYTATETGHIRIDTFGSSFDTVLSVHTPPCPGDEGNEIACDDDCGSLQSCVAFPATAGNSYLVRVGGYSVGEAGPVTLNISLTGAIAGTVTDAVTTSPLPGIYIEIYDADGDYYGYDQTNALGEYSVGGLPAGTFYAIAYGDYTYLDELYDNIPCTGGNCDLLDGTPIAVVAGTSTDGIDFALEEGGKISGTVTDEETGSPISYVEVDIYDNTGGYAGYAYTDSAGKYTLEGLPTGSYRAIAYTYQDYVNELYDNIPCPGNCDPVSGTPIPVTQPETTSGIDFALEPMGRIAGTVTDESTGQPISDVEIDIVDENGNWVGYGYTDGSGSYTTSGLPDGSYFLVTYNYSGYIDELYNDIPCPLGNCDVWSGTPVSVNLPATTTGIDFALKVGGKISGMVRDNYNGNPLDSVRVRVYDQYGEYVSYAYTDGSGAYTTGGLPTGTYFVRTRNYDGYIDELYDNFPCPGGNCDPTSGTPVAVTVSQTTADVDFELQIGGRITGRVMTSSNQPIEYAEVDIFDSAGDWVDYGYTDAGGHYTVRGLLTGTYHATTYNWDGYLDELFDNIPCAFGCDPTTGTPIAVTTGQTTSKINFALDTGGSISGTLTESPSGIPISYVGVEIYDTTGDYVSYGYTDELGEYTAYGLPTGTYLAATTTYGDYINEIYDNIPCPHHWCNVTGETGTLIPVTVAQDTPGIDFALDLGGSISGTVTAEDTGLPIRDVEVDIFDSNGDYFAYGYTDGAGRYSAGGLSTGAYRVLAYDYGSYLPELYDNIPCYTGCDPGNGTPVSVVVSQDTPGIDFALTQGGSISGTITDAQSGVPLEDVGIDVFNNQGDYVADAYTNHLGQYTARRLPTGTYFLIAYNYNQHVPQLYQNLPCPFGNCDPTTGTPVSVTISQNTSGIDFSLQEGGRILGKITSSSTGNPIGDVGVVIYTDTGQYAGYGYSDYQGRYSTGGLPDGNYFVLTSNWAGYVDEIYDNIYCPNGSCDVEQGTPVAVTLGQATENIDFALDRGGRIRGTVRDASNQRPLEYVYVEIFDSSSNYVGYGYTDYYGRYMVGGLPAGSYYARTYNWYGYTDELYDNVPCPDGNCNWSAGTLIALPAQGSVSGIDFDLESDDYLYGDDFEDGELCPDWTYTKPGWSEWDGNLTGTPVGKKTSAIASPAFGGCSECSFEATLETAGGDYAKIWMLAWYVDKKNTFELLMNESGNRWILKQRVNGTVVKKAKAVRTIEPETFYRVRMLFDGSQVLVYVDDMTTPIISLTPSGQPAGTAGFAVKSTTGAFGYLEVQ